MTSILGWSFTNEEIQFATKSMKFESQSKLVSSRFVPFRAISQGETIARSALALVPKQPKKSADLLSGISRRMSGKRRGEPDMEEAWSRDMQRRGRTGASLQRRLFGRRESLRRSSFPRRPRRPRRRRREYCISLALT